MQKLRQKYESVIIISIKLAEEEIKSVVEKFKNLISEHAVLLDVQEWGKRKLAYPVNHDDEGYYVLFNFESDHSFPAEFGRQCKIDDSVVRFMTVVKNEEVVKNKKAKVATSN